MDISPRARRASIPLAAVFATLAGVACGTAVAAEDLFEIPLESLMEMRVSVASPFAESVMDSASSVSVLRPADWQRRGARSLEEALEQVPSVVAYASLGGASMYAIRGYANELSVRGTAMQLDGVPLNSYSYSTAAYSLPFVALPLLERAEVIRGTGSTLYGADAFHGVLALNTWQPGARHREARVESGAHGRGQAALTHALDAGPLRGSLGLAHTHAGPAGTDYDYTDPLTGLPGRGTWDNREENAAGFLRLESGDPATGHWRLGFFADRYEGEDFPGTGTQFFRPLLAVVQAQSADFLRDSDRTGQTSDFWLAQLQHEREIGDAFRLDLRAFQWRNEQTWVLKSWGYPGDNELRALDGTPLPCRRSVSDSPLTVSQLYCPHTQYQGTSEQRRGLHALLRHDGAAGTQWAFGAGRDWFDILEAPLRRIGLDGSVYYDTPTPFEGAKRHVDHLLLQARTDIQHWSFVYGVRHDDYSDINDAATSPRLAIIYRQPDTNWSGKLLYGHAFRAPSAAEQFGSGGGTQQLAGTNLKPETIDTLELVLQVRRDNTDTELVLFGSRWVDGIVLVPVGSGVNQYVNTGENSARGIELMHHRAIGRWRAEGNIAWVFSENDRTGLEYSGFPAWIGNLTLSRRFGDWELALTERIMLDATEGDALGAYVPPQAPAYVRTDLHLGWRRGDVLLGFDVRNLFDRDNVAPSMFNASGGTPEAGTTLLMSLELSL